MSVQLFLICGPLQLLRSTISDILCWQAYIYYSTAAKHSIQRSKRKRQQVQIAELERRSCLRQKLQVQRNSGSKDVLDDTVPKFSLRTLGTKKKKFFAFYACVSTRREFLNQNPNCKDLTTLCSPLSQMRPVNLSMCIFCTSTLRLIDHRTSSLFQGSVGQRKTKGSFSRHERHNVKQAVERSILFCSLQTPTVC